MSESEYDAFGTGHSSTSISATLGMAMASRLSGNTTRQHIAIIGDGSLTGGMSFEAINNAGVAKTNILVIINDNGIAIDENVGGMSQYFSQITSSKTYNRIRNKIWNMLGGNSKSQYRRSKSIIRKLLAAIKALLFSSNSIYEQLGFRYFGPINGNNIKSLVDILQDLKEINGPKVLHIITKKGKGLNQAENDPVNFHAPGKFDVLSGERKPEKSNLPMKFQDVFGLTLVELADMSPKIVGITPAMATGSSMTFLQKAYPARFFDVGIAEQHAVTFAAGLATQGFVPFCNIYSSFMQRAIDQIIHDVALQDLHVVFCLDRAGLVGEDGATHHGAFDLALLKSVPNLIIAAPSNEIELRNMMFTAMNSKHPFVIRYPRGRGNITDWHQPLSSIEIGKGCRVESLNFSMNEQNGGLQTFPSEAEKSSRIDKNHIALVCIGTTVNNALEAAKILANTGINVDVFDMRFLKPLDTKLLHEILKTHQTIITIEDGVINGGFGSAVADFAVSVEASLQHKIIKLGIPDKFVEHGCTSQLQKECGYDVDGIVACVRLAFQG
jgi:1-deoxy-D-xylulose-5-phosphate synthase